MPMDQGYWFPPKTHGLGWGLPVRWQGWLTFALWAVSQIASGLVLMPQSPGVFLLSSTIVTALLVLVCYLKGAPAKWRWGDKV